MSYVHEFTGCVAERSTARCLYRQKVGYVEGREVREEGSRRPERWCR